MCRRDNSVWFSGWRQVFIADSVYSQVVDQNSATLGWPGEIVVPIDANHRNICRFTGEKDHRIAPVLSNVRQMFREIRMNYLSNVQIKRKNANG